MSSLTSIVSKGIASFMLSTVIVKLTALVSQVALGWFLSKEDYGVFGVALSLTAFVACFQENCIMKYLIQQDDDFSELKDYGFFLSLCFALFAMLLLVTFGWYYGHHTGNSQITILSIVLGCGALLGFPVPVYRALTSKELRFKEVACIDGIKQALSQLLMIPLAALGFGAYSLAIPRPGLRIFELFAYRRRQPLLFMGSFWKNVRLERLATIFKKVRWLMLSALLIALVQRGDYFVFGLSVNPLNIGVYFFGFQLVATFSNMVTSSLNHVFMPALSRLNGNSAQQLGAFERANTHLLCIAFPTFYSLLLIIPAIIHVVWCGKWDDAIIVCQILCLVMPFRMLVPICRALLEARGQWRISTVMVGINAAGVLLSAYLGSLTGTVLSMVTWVAAWQLLYSCVVHVAVRVILQIEFLQPLFFLLRQVVCSIGALIVVIFVYGAAIFDGTGFLQSCFICMLYAICSVLFLLLLSWREYSELIRLFSGRLNFNRRIL